jgi:ethanolamine utilization protein EutQ (cupin superfamily)
LGLVLEGDLALKSQGETTNYLMGELFFIDKVTRFELQAGPAGVKYLFAFK